MATIYGKAGDNAFQKSLTKQQDVLSAIVLVCFIVFLVLGVLWGLSFSKHWPTRWISFVGILLVPGLYFCLRKKINQILERQLPRYSGRSSARRLSHQSPSKIHRQTEFSLRKGSPRNRQRPDRSFPKRHLKATRPRHPALFTSTQSNENAMKTLIIRHCPRVHRGPFIAGRAKICIIPE